MGNAKSAGAADNLHSTFGVSQAYMKSCGDPDYILSFDKHQRRLIEKVWARALADPKRNVSVEIFDSILTRSSRIRKAFNLEPTKERDLMKYGRFVSHAAIVKNALDYFIKLWVQDDPKVWQEIASKIRSLGARHFLVPNEYFGPDLWNVFAEGLTEIATTWTTPLGCRKEFQNCWRDMTYFMLANMKIGYKNAVLSPEVSNGELCNFIDLPENLKEFSLSIKGI